uniref:Uncharacterized protein n=1 Tax=Siphoviridae sp. ctngK14 TaxID=2827940 RepID=A0A8S5TBJ8_9CAUD|nr:MAG TPA: hypothetical protein [Siphoviridae sp. ctngK14]
MRCALPVQQLSKNERAQEHLSVEPLQSPARSTAAGSALKNQGARSIIYLST